MKKNSVSILDQKEQLRKEARGIVELAQTEKRELTEEEQGRIEEIKEEQKALDDELKELEEKAKRTEDKPENEPSATDDENKENNTRMKQNFSILKAIRSVANGQELDPIASAVVKAGREEMRGLTTSGQIQIPIEERSIVVTGGEGEHDNVIATDLFQILEPLQHKLALAQAGARFVTGLVNDVQYPVMGPGSVNWEGETDEADDLDPDFSNVKLQPKRLAATIEISKQMLVQDSVGVENAIRNELVNAIAQKLEGTILGTAAGTSTKPAGIFNGSTDTVSDFAGICEKEAELEAAKFTPEHYILSPSAKAALRSMIKGTNGTGMVFENGEVDGTPAVSTGLISGKKVAVGQFDQMVVANWGALDITVDPYTKAKNGLIVLTINSFWDCKVLREGAIKTYTITGGDEPIS